MGAATVLPLIAGHVADSSAADNDTATATISAIEAVRHIALGLHADYSAEPAAGYKAITLTITKNGTSTSYVFRHDFSTGAFSMALPVGVAGDYNTAVTATLAASGTSSVTGRVKIFYISS